MVFSSMEGDKAAVERVLEGDGGLTHLHSRVRR
jgi:hypothetical protein